MPKNEPQEHVDPLGKRKACRVSASTGRVTGFVVLETVASGRTQGYQLLLEASPVLATKTNAGVAGLNFALWVQAKKDSAGFLVMSGIYACKVLAHDSSSGLASGATPRRKNAGLEYMRYVRLPTRHLKFGNVPNTR